MSSDKFGVTAGANRNRRRAKEGRGKGSGQTYRPQLNTHDVPSRGRSTRMPLNEGRMAHLLSDLETRLTLECRWSKQVSDFKEQFPLPLARTLAIAEQMGFCHPTIPGDSAPAVITTDAVFVIEGSLGERLCARSVKQSSDIDVRNFDRPRKAAELLSTLAKLELERRYWQENGADWRLVCEQDLDRTRAANIQLLLSWEGLSREHGPVFWQDALDLSASTLLLGDDRSLSELGGRLERDGKLSQRHFMDCVRHMCAGRELTFDMRQHFGPDLRACDFKVEAK